MISRVVVSESACAAHHGEDFLASVKLGPADADGGGRQHQVRGVEGPLSENERAHVDVSQPGAGPALGVRRGTCDIDGSVSNAAAPSLATVVVEPMVNLVEVPLRPRSVIEVPVTALTRPPRPRAWSIRGEAVADKGPSIMDW